MNIRDTYLSILYTYLENNFKIYNSILLSRITLDLQKYLYNTIFITNNDDIIIFIYFKYYLRIYLKNNKEIKKIVIYTRFDNNYNKKINDFILKLSNTGTTELTTVVLVK